MNGTQSPSDQVVSAAIDALVADAIAAVREHPEYANEVTQLASQALSVILAGS